MEKWEVWMDAFRIERAGLAWHWMLGTREIRVVGAGASCWDGGLGRSSFGIGRGLRESVPPAKDSRVGEGGPGWEFTPHACRPGRWEGSGCSLGHADPFTPEA